MKEKDTARFLALGRIGLGLAMVLFPGPFARLWTGQRHASFPTNMITRGLGARDLALGLGTLAALEGPGSPSRWLQACAVADAGDALGTLSSMRELGGVRATGLLALEAGAAAVGFSLAESLDA